MFSSGPNYSKLKTNLRLAVNRLKLLEKKKTELALKARKEIADYIGSNKVERARIRVEHIIREDYLVEAYEIIEMLADLLLARFGLLQQMKDPDEGLKEAISSLIWVAPRIQADVPELKIIGDLLISKYGKPYGTACHDNSVGTVSPKLIAKLSVQAPPKHLVEKYLIEIAKIYNVHYEPDAKFVEPTADENLIDVGTENAGGNNLGGFGNGGDGGSGGGATALPMSPNQPGFIGYPYMPMPAAPMPPNAHLPAYKPFQYPNVPGASTDEKFPLSSNSPPPDFTDYKEEFNIPPEKELNTNVNYQDDSKPKAAPRKVVSPNSPDVSSMVFPEIPELPAVPTTNPSDPAVSNGRGRPHETDENDIDFDDLTKRFEELKKRK